LLVPLLVTACAAPRSTASSREPTAGGEEGAATTRHELGGYVVYRYEGTYTAAPVTLEETITALDGLRLTIEVTATRGDESRRWIQVVTDTEENRRNNVVDELYEVIDGERRALDAHDVRELLRLYAWTLPSCGPFEEPPDPEPRSIDIGGASHECRCVPARTICDGAAATSITCECPDFAWGNAYGEVILDGAEGEPMWRVRVTESGVRR
jgi:hypothetical protein